MDAPISAVRHDVVNTDNTTPGVHNEVSDSYRNASKRREDADGQNRAVCITHTLTVVK